MRSSARFWLLLSAALLPRLAWADMGSIPFEKDAVVMEPTQRALIACNGKEEILILSTDLQANKKTKVLEIMPFPSEPKIKKADVEVFKKATDMINKRLARLSWKGLRPSALSGSFGALGEAGAEPPPAGRVTFHERIGAHDISVTHVERRDGFVKWAQDHLRSLNVAAPVIPKELTAVVDDYIKDNFNQPFTLTGKEVADLSKDIHVMLGKPDSVKIRHWEVHGKLSSFEDDVIMGDAKDFLDHIRGKTEKKADAAPNDPDPQLADNK